MGWSRRKAYALGMMVERFAVWHGVEQRIDVWASAGALAVGGLATLAAFAVGPF